MIFRKLRSIQIQLVLSLLIALSGVFVCDSLCDLGILDIQMRSGRSTRISHVIDDNQSNEVKHDHKHGVTHHNDHHEIQKHDHADGDHQHNNSDECCEEETSQLLASLVTHELPNFETEYVPVLLQAVIYDVNYISFHHHKNTDPYRLNSSLSPPISGSFIRVLHQSFLC
ncbi:MAG: hypothetical protein CMP48_08365 [Rickettsiales bacterium]|nr:hypothetical protein [Rickettsiales bacterium]